MPLPKAVVSWSSGKDSAWALHCIKLQGTFELVGILTTLNETVSRVAMHGIRRNILQQQAASLGMELFEVFLPYPCPNKIYEGRMKLMLDGLKTRYEISAVVFGDLYLEDIRSYRERQLEMAGLEAVFPLWQVPTRALSREMLSGGLRAFTSCVDTRHLGKNFSGRAWNERFISSLPEAVDPCGENGEFHTVVVDGPMFEYPLEIEAGQQHEDLHFVFSDFNLVEQ